MTIPKSIRILTIKNQEYKRFHVTGFWGGLTPDGQKLNIELFEDAPAMAEEVTLLAQEGSNIFVQEVKQPEFPIHRHVHAGITIPVGELPSIIEWLKQKYEEHLSQISNQNRNHFN